MFFSKMKEKTQKAYRITSYDEIFIDMLSSMFVYRGEGVPEEILARQSFINKYAALDGAAAICKMEGVPTSGPSVFDGKYIIGKAESVGTPDPYGFGADLMVTGDNGFVKRFENWIENPEVAVIFNNTSYTPDMNIGRYSDALAELEVSLKLNVLFSRMYPIPLASDTKVKKSIEEAIKNMQDGKIATIMDERKLREIIDQAKGIETVNLTDAEKSTYIQYLAKYRDDLMRWFYSLYGMNSQGSSKLAQQTVDEVNQDSNASMILPHSMLKARQDGVEMCNKKFGWNMEVSFSECWMSRLANMDDEFKTTDEELQEKAPEEEGGKEDETERLSDSSDPE